MHGTPYQHGAQSSIRVAVISIATYQRPELLNALLKACDAQRHDVSATVRVVVVDNDPSETARSCVSEYPFADYVPEPAPGIAAARNRGLDSLRPEDDAIIFIDDDEVPTDGWLRSLIDYAEESGADIVTGPVQPLIDDRVPSWLLEGGFWHRESHATGSTPASVATNNTLLLTRTWRRSQIRFSEALSMKGGSDTEFFRALRRSTSASALWCQEAAVSEHILPERANARWLFRRAVRIGNINARYRGRVRAVLGGIARIAVGAPYIAVDYVVHRQPMARSWNMLAHGIGMIGNVMNADVIEYRRQTSGE